MNNLELNSYDQTAGLPDSWSPPFLQVHNQTFSGQGKTGQPKSGKKCSNVHDFLVWLCGEVLILVSGMPHLKGVNVFLD